MKLVVHLNSITYIEDFLDMSVEMFVVGTDIFSCRQALSLNYQEIYELKEKINQRAKVYVLVNALVEQEYLLELERHLEKLYELKIDGILFHDFGVLQICKEKGYTFDMMYTPDTLNTNQATLSFLKTQGITSAFLAREIPLVEKQAINTEVDMPLMIQIHGVEYMAYSKRNLLTNYSKQTNKQLKTTYQDNIMIQANNVEDACYIYEDQYGSHILTSNQLCCLDVLSNVTEFAYGYIESLYLSDIQLLEVVYLYKQGLEAVFNNTYGKVSKEIMPLLHQLDNSIKYYHGFLFDQTVYTIKDVRKREEDEGNK